MSETLTTSGNVSPENYDDAPIDTTRLLALKSTGWSPMAKPRLYHPKAIEPDKIAAIDQLPIRERVIASAYYALQLNDNSLKSVQEAADGFNKINTPPGSARSPVDQKIVDDFLIASAVTDMLEDAYDRYSSSPVVEEISVKQKTAKYKPEKETKNDEPIGGLYSLKRLREVKQADKRVPESIARSSEVILRMVIADWEETFKPKKQPEIE